MTPDEIRKKIREKIERGELPHPDQFPSFPFGYRYVTYHHVMMDGNEFAVTVSQS